MVILNIFNIKGGPVGIWIKIHLSLLQMESITLEWNQGTHAVAYIVSEACKRRID